MNIKKTNKYYIRVRATQVEPEKLKAVEGKPVVIFDWLDTFIYWDEKIRIWAVTELKTGTWISVSMTTQKKAIEKAKEILELIGKEKALANIEKMIIEKGELIKII
jgi:hypothetical protein